MRGLSFAGKLAGYGVVIVLVGQMWAIPLSALPQNAPATTSANASRTAPNAGNQQNSGADLKLAARIRRAVYRDKSLSTRAHNITIIVRNGTVTLRGAVKTAAEKDAIRRKAAALAGSATINDMLTVESR